MYHLENSTNGNRTMPEGMFLRMVDDTNRLNDAVKPALKNTCADKVIIDLGCGTGILGLYALENSAKFVYFVEQNDYMIEILQNALPKIIDPSRFKIIHKFAQDLVESDFDNGAPDICVSELWGVQLFDEGYYHCTNPLKKIFNNLTFIPEIFHLDIFECDVDYDDTPWPQNEKHLIEHYKYMYATLGWTKWAVGNDKLYKNLNPKKIGEISYNANTGVFNNSLSVVLQPNDGKMINFSGTILSGGVKQGPTLFGWYIYPCDEKLMIDIHISKDTEDSRIHFSVKTHE